MITTAALFAVQFQRCREDCRNDLARNAFIRSPHAHHSDEIATQLASSGSLKPQLLLATLWGALATCVLGALAYDIAYWLDGW